MTSGTHQVVSEHSILGAQKDTQKEMEFTRKGSRRRTRGDERRSRRNHAPCRKKVKRGIVSQKLHEIYLDHKWRMLQQFCVKEKSRKPEEGRETEKNQNGGEVLAPSVGTKTKSSCNMDGHFFSLRTSQTDETMKENDGYTSECYNGDDGPKWDSYDEESSSEEMTQGELLPEKGYATTTLTRPFCTLSETFLDLAREERDLEVGKTKSRQAITLSEADMEISEEEPSPAEPPPGKVSPTLLLSSEQESRKMGLGCDREWKENKSRVGWKSREVDHVINPMGQAHNFIITPPLFAKRVLQEGNEGENIKASVPMNIEHICYNLFDRDEVKNGMILFLKNPEYWDDNGEVKKVGIGKSCCSDLMQLKKVAIMRESLFAYKWDPGGIKQDGWKPSGLGQSGSMLESDNTYVLESYRNQTHQHHKEEEKDSGFTEFGWHKILVEQMIKGTKSSKMSLAETFHKLWDPDELYSASCIIGKSCFKLWDPGGRVLIVVLYLHLEDKVNV